jgi:hypothetical protein
VIFGFLLRKGVKNDSIDIVKEKSSKFMPCPSTGSKMFWNRPKTVLHLVLVQKTLCWHKNQVY